MHASQTFIRFLGSLCLAFSVVSVMLWFALEVSGFTDSDGPRSLETHVVDLLTAAERRELRDVLGEGRPERAPPMASPAAVASAQIAREVHGMVRLEVDIDATGQVSGVRVIDATPAGIYETQAVADVRRRRYSPDIVGGRPVPSRRLEIVDFTITPAAPAMAGAE